MTSRCLLPRHREPDCLLRVDEVFLRRALGDRELYALDLSVERVAERTIVGRDGRAAVFADITTVVGREDGRERCTDTPFADVLAVDEQGHIAALAQAAPVVCEFHPHLVRALRNRRGALDEVAREAAMVITFVCAASVVAFWVARYAFAVNKLSRGIGQTYFYSADGKPWFPLEEHRIDVPLARISPDLQHAVVAVEDHRFYTHPGIDFIGIGRAVFRDLRAGGIEEGASTLTQQLARTLFLTNQRDFTRKFKEMVLALMIEQRLAKPQILELYLNRIYLGGSVYGVEAMSRNTFGKPAANLTLAESAFMAESRYSPS